MKSGNGGKRKLEALDLNGFYNPQSIAIVGASQNLTSIGGRPLNNLIRHKFQGSIYPEIGRAHV